VMFMLMTSSRTPSGTGSGLPSSLAKKPAMVLHPEKGSVWAGGERGEGAVTCAFFVRSLEWRAHDARRGRGRSVGPDLARRARREAARAVLAGRADLALAQVIAGARAAGATAAA
jgi:hypothetical protein